MSMSMSRQCVAVCMARNNGDVIHAFMEHLLALFDHAVIIDHRSTDGTKEYLDALADRYPQQLSLYHFLDEGFYQSELMTWIARNKAACREADWLFFLDTDEFLPFGDRSAFDAALYAFRDEAVIRMPWKNLAPVTYDDSSLHERSYYAAKQESVFCKIAFQPGLLDPDDLIVLQGNHALQRAGSGKKLKGRHAFPLLHVPITNREQYALKVLLIHLARRGHGLWLAAFAAYGIIAVGDYTAEEMEGKVIEADGLPVAGESVAEGAASTPITNGNSGDEAEANAAADRNAAIEAR